MIRDWTFGRKVGAGFTVAGLIILLVGAVGYRSTQRLIENNALVEHTHVVQREIAVLLSLLTDAETGQRGFIITGSEPYLEPYQSALEDIDRTFASLRALASDNPNQVRRIEGLRPEIDARLAVLARIIALRKTDGLETAAKAMLGGQGKEFMDRIRRITSEMNDEEAALLTRRSSDAEASAGQAQAVILWGSLAGLALLAVIGWFITASLSRQVGAAVRHVQSSAAELQAAANQQAGSARQQANAMSEITTTISELLATSRQIAESAKRVAQIAEQTTASARFGDSAVGKGNESMSGIRRQVDLIVNHMLELGKKSQRVGTVLEIVAELAEQTNILAINATIEATGAGETGKRFAVVADEIRKLADRVASSTKEIRGLIEDVRGSANTTVMSTESGSKAVDSGLNQFSEVATAFKQIAGLVMTTTEAAKEIELSTKQQASAVEQVDIAITNVAQASQETEVSTGQMLQTASQLSGLSHDLLQLVQPQARG